MRYALGFGEVWCWTNVEVDDDAKVRGSSVAIVGFEVSVGLCMGWWGLIGLLREEGEGIYRGVVGMGWIRGVEREGCAGRFGWGLCNVMNAKAH